MIVLTDSAVDAVRTAIGKAAAQKAETTTSGLRIQVETGGCAGYKYMMGLVATPDPDDTVVSSGGASVLIDPARQPLLAGTTIDFVVALEGSGFTFENPNANNSCS